MPHHLIGVTQGDEELALASKIIYKRHLNSDIYQK